MSKKLITHKEALVEGSDYKLSLSAVMGKKVKDVYGYVSTEFGEPTFQLSQIIFEDGTEIWCEGEHDMPYVTGVNEEVLENIEKTDPDYEPDEEE